MDISKLGFTSLQEKNLNYDSSSFNIARIISVNKESYIVNNGNCELFAKITGNLMFTAESSLDFPTTGDFVLIQAFENDSTVLIHKVLKRKTLLKRKTSGKKIDYQLIAANVDYVFIMQALDNDFNINRLERYLSMVNEFGIDPIILLSKSDLISESELNKTFDELNKSHNKTKIISFSNLDTNLSEIDSLLFPTKTYCLIGSSGVGKTTLLNNLLGIEEFKTSGVRVGDNKGKHTTTARQLVLLNNGAIIIDTPGMRELGNISVTEGINKTFLDISSLTEQCKFNDCTHIKENGCAVLEALEKDEISKKRYDNFIKLRKESDYYERSYLENKKHEKKFTKMCKSIIKNNRKKK